MNKGEIHMVQKSGLNGFGWTRCGRSKYVIRTNNWRNVTCRNCLKLKKNLASEKEKKQ